ncbi:MAG: proprotein convertase P-domain-containing protein, partial [Saprospiraceae bacterium]|nr:proprotein convertase P-domain-containing protein [Saprospiraceae bacterium]
ISVNRVSGVYETELATRLTLVATELNVVFTNAGSDPFTGNNNANTLINESQTVIDMNIGTANYDIGHTFSTGGGGLAQLGCVCGSSKARGITGSGNPVGDAYDIDYVAHEMGHQFGGSHTFNGDAGNCSGNRSASSAYEVGSGSTIQAYAGICGSNGNQDLQDHSDAYFHIRSLEQMMTFIQGGGNCATVVAGTPTNTSPQIISPVAGTTYTIPKSTPFFLTGAATDANSDALTYCWEEWDLGTAGQINAASTTAPIFRSFLPTTSPMRYFPKLSDVVAGTTTYGEVLPTVARTLNFKLTARDNRPTANGGGGFCRQQYTVTVADLGPFDVTSQNTSVTWLSGQSQAVTWNPNGTAGAPINCANVNILLSTDGGVTFPTTLASNVPNNGTYNITVPNVVTATGRIMVVCANNIFYDVNVANILINAAVTTACNTHNNTTTQTISGSGMPTITSTITVPTGSTISDINVLGLNITHTYISDIRATLTGPSGTSVQLVSGVCTSDDNMNISFDSQAAAGAIPCPPTGGGTYQPSASLNAFNGQSAVGTWTLTIQDLFDVDGGSLNSWSLQVCTATVTLLAAEITSLTAKPAATTIAIDWSTANEQNNKGFEVQRSAGTSDRMMPIGFVQGKGNSTSTVDYNLIDENVLTGITYYYRLKQIDNDGREQYSDVVAAKIEGKPYQVTVLPNPAHAVLNLFVETATGEEASVQIIDAAGRLLQQASANIVSNNIAVDISSLPRGIYFIRVNINDNIQVLKFVAE